MLLVVLIYSILALTFVFAKKTLAYANPFFLIGFRMILAGTILLLHQRFFSKTHFSINKSDYWLFFKVALFHIYFSFIFEFWSMQYLSALKITIIYSATPFIAAILSYILLKERLSWQKVLGIIIGLGGLAPILHCKLEVVGHLKKLHIFRYRNVFCFWPLFQAHTLGFWSNNLWIKAMGLG